MRRSFRHALALTTVAGLLVTGCGDGAAEDASPTAEQTPEQTAAPSGAPDGNQTDAAGDLPDPSENIEDGVYSGNGVRLPIPDGWSVDPAAAQQGLVAAISEDGTQQLTAQAIDAEAAAAAGGQALEFETLLDGIRQQIEQEPEVDEEVDLAGAARAHRLTFLGLPAQQEGAPETSATIVLADDGEGLIGEFAFQAVTDSYDEDTAELLLAQAGFDPDSEPPALQQ